MSDIGQSHTLRSGQVNQSGIVAFLADKSSYPWPVERLERRETHGAIIFLTEEFAVKIKKAVSFAYMDFSTLEKRENACRREFELNKKTAPQIYIAVKPVTQDQAGNLAFDGEGHVVEWCVLMKRFDESDLLSNLARSGRFSNKSASELAATIAKCHFSAPRLQGVGFPSKLHCIIDDIASRLKREGGHCSHEDVLNFERHAKGALSQAEDTLIDREESGFVRRCHGDLHLNNIVMIEAKPVLFDAIEFDEELASIDMFYDIAFTIMDLIAVECNSQANFLLNRYLYCCQIDGALGGLIAMPLFLALRAGVRSMVLTDQAAQMSGNAKLDCEAKAKSYFELAREFQRPRAPRLIALGGLSGTGKSTLAAGIAPHLGIAPGAIHLRSDIERKALARVPETDRLPEKFYTPQMSDRIYALLAEKSKAILNMGYTVIVDAVFLKPQEREDIAQIASKLKVPFSGLWLSAPPDEMKKRVSTRKGDASDATSQVIDKQLTRNTGPISWHVIDAGGSADESAQQALRLLQETHDLKVKPSP